MPAKIDLTYGKPLHDYIRDQVCQRKKLSEKKMKDFHTQWGEAEDSMRAYIHERDVDKQRKNDKTYRGEVDYVTLEVPYAYATIMTAHTYYSSVMLGRAPTWQFTARHGETQDAINAVEAIMDYQQKVGGMLPVMYNWLYDLSRYSLGVVGNYWDEEQVTITKKVPVQRSVLGIPFGQPREEWQTETVYGYVGNRLYNIRPFDFYPDPRVAIWKFQEGEFCGRNCVEGVHNIIAGAQADPSRYQNLDILQEKIGSGGEGLIQGSSRVELPLGPNEGGRPVGAGYADIHEMYIKVIPSMWGLTPSNRQEIWVFEVANNDVVLSARPLGLAHGKFPFSVMEGNFGSDEFAKFGMLEVIRPMTDILTWLVNSHFYNVRRVLNNQLVVDPSKVVMKDLTKPGQRIIRLKPEAYGSDVRSFVHQLQHVDVTRSHMSDIQQVESLIQRVSSVVDNVMGVPQRGGRKTATEVRDSTGWSVSRLRTPVEYNSSLAMDPLAQMMLSNTQSLLKVQRKYAIAGNTLDSAQAFLDVNTERIAGFYDFVPIDGTMPIDRLAQANFWKELLMGMAKMPQLAMAWDMNGMLAHVMKMQGERNIDRFRIKINDPAALAQQAQAGNIIPLPAGGKGGNAGGAGNPNPRPTGTSGGSL